MTAGGAGGAGAGGLARSLERLLEEAALSGELRLAGRKLRALPPAHPHHAAALRDTTRADLSKNRFSEFPEEITTYLYLEKLLLAQNVIRHVPEAVGALHSLTYLDLSCNQLTELPREICQIPLEVLLLSENRLTSLPKEIGKMAALAELDASHNCIAQVPLTIGDVSTLKALNLSNNQLGLLPLQITYLKLEWLDVSCNCISSLPLELRNMTSLVTLSLDNNPLVSPPTTVCMRGRVHIFKYLESMASKDSAAGHRRAEDTRRATKHTSYVSSTAQGAAHQIVSGNATIDCLRHRARRVDSGYSTSDAADKRSSSDVCGDGGGGVLECSAGSVPGSGRSTPSTPSTLSPGAALSRAHSLSGESPLVPLTPQLSGMRISPEGGAASNGDDKAKLSHQQTYRQYKEALRQQRQQDVYRPRTDQPSPELDSSPQSQSPVHKLSHSTPHSPVANGHYTILSNSSVYSRSTSSNSTLNGTSSTPNTSQMPNSPLLHSTPRRYQTSVPQATLSNGNGLPDTKPEELQNKRPVQKVVPSRNVNKMYTNTIINGNVEYQNGRIPTSGSMPRIRSSNSPDGDVYVKPVSPIKSPTFSVPPNNVRSGISSRHGAGGDAKLLTTSVAYVKGAIVKGPAGNGSRISWSKEVPPDKLSFTMKREFDKQKEELDLLQQLRSIIESRLKMSLPTELAPVLADGVVLCHLANHVRPRAVASVHVPSPAQPKLTMARCRRNVDNFLEACRKMGVEEEEICSPEDILTHHPDSVDGGATEIAPLARTLAALLAHTTTHETKDFNFHTANNPYRPLHVQTSEQEFVHFNQPAQNIDNQSYDEMCYRDIAISHQSQQYGEDSFYQNEERTDSRSYHINYFQSKLRCRYMDDRLISNFNSNTFDSPNTIYEADEYQMNLQNNNGDLPVEDIYSNEGLKYRNNYSGNVERVHLVTPYYEGPPEERSIDQVDSAVGRQDTTGRYVRGKMNLDIQDNLNHRLNAEVKKGACPEDNRMVTCLCLGAFFMTALLLYLYPL